MKLTRIHLRGEAATRRVWINDIELTPDRSLQLMQHSPDGFNWGYHGSGPAQLALAIMLHVNDKAAGYQDFKSNVIAMLPRGIDFSEHVNVPDYD